MADSSSQHAGYIDGVNLTISICLTYTLCVSAIRVWIRRRLYGWDDIVVGAATVALAAQLKLQSSQLLTTFADIHPWVLRDKLRLTLGWLGEECKKDIQRIRLGASNAQQIHSGPQHTLHHHSVPFQSRRGGLSSADDEDQKPPDHSLHLLRFVRVIRRWIHHCHYGRLWESSDILLLGSTENKSVLSFTSRRFLVDTSSESADIHSADKMADRYSTRHRFGTSSCRSPAPTDVGTANEAQEEGHHRGGFLDSPTVSSAHAAMGTVCLRPVASSAFHSPATTGPFHITPLAKTPVSQVPSSPSGRRSRRHTPLRQLQCPHPKRSQTHARPGSAGATRSEKQPHSTRWRIR